MPFKKFVNQLKTFVASLKNMASHFFKKSNIYFSFSFINYTCMPVLGLSKYQNGILYNASLNCFC